MMRLAALAAMVLVLGGCDAVDCAGTTDNRCMDPGYAERMRANRESMASHFTPDGDIRRDIRRVDFKSMSFNTGLNIVHDDQRGVTCWVFAAPGGGAGSCLPDWMIKQDEVKP